MNLSATQLSTWAVRRLGALLAAATLAACGGGDGVIGSGGTGSPLGVAVGTVNGFGSVVVDGQSFDDRSATVVTEVAPGVDANAEARLGDRVAVEYETPGIARVVRVEAALVARIDSVTMPGRFSVLGQVVAVNTDGALGPVTQFGGGYLQSADLRAGDAVEVHGLIVLQGGGVQIHATRVDKLAALPDYLRVRGVVGGLQAGSAPGFVLGSLTVDSAGAAVLPAGIALANGQTVTVLALAANVTSPAQGAWRLQAAQVRIGEPGTLGDDSLEDSISGSVEQLDPVARTFSLGTLRVDYASAALSPSTWTPANGQYVLVRGATDARGTLVASSVTLRETDSDSEAELHGNITDYDAAALRFNVRGVPVDAATAALEGCPRGGLADGLYVEVEGSMSSGGVVAKSVHCEDEPDDASVEREGIAGSVDTAARQFELSLEHDAPVPVRWTDATYFGGVTPATLAGRKVQVEGSFVDGMLEARKVKGED
jgi:hypothetical protein